LFLNSKRLKTVKTEDLMVIQVLNSKLVILKISSIKKFFT